MSGMTVTLLEWWARLREWLSGGQAEDCWYIRRP